jgi:hypothetical protein
MWQPHQFIRHMAEPKLKVSAFIYILILILILIDIDIACNLFSHESRPYKCEMRGMLHVTVIQDTTSKITYNTLHKLLFLCVNC